MICANCRTQNPDGARFCSQCGSRLPAGCPRCGHLNPDGARFCNDCGFSLVEGGASVQVAATPAAPAAPTTKLDALRSYLSTELPARPDSPQAHGGVEGERRIVTTLFCDVKGSTAAAARLDPEEWTEIINGAFEPMIAPVHQYDGAVVRLMGDGILALFGAPVSHEDDPQRAVLAGLAIVEGVTQYGQQVQERWGIEFSVRVGINTGLVVVGAVGSAGRLEYTAMGDAINIAARMEQTADPGTVRIAEETYKLIASQFEVEELGGIVVRGKDAPVNAYRVVRSRYGSIRGRHLSRLQTPLIGRNWELRALEQAMERVAQGQGGIVCLVGDAGMGKSRLLHEAAQLWRQMTQRPDRWYVTGSLSYETGVPYAQFMRLLRQGAGLLPGDSPDTVRRKLSVYTDTFANGEREQAQLVFEQMFALPAARQNRPLEGEAFKAALFSTVLHLSRTWTASDPMVLVLDDLQWADPATIELLIHLFQLANQACILFLCATRINRQAPGWQVTTLARERFSQFYTEIWLHPLSRGDSEHLLASLAGPDGLAPALRQQIVQKTEGNPLFVEEVVLSILEGGDRTANADQEHVPYSAISADDIEIPDTLQALLLSRVDRLDEEARYVVQLASVIGYQFQRAVLQAIVEQPADIDRQLAALQEHELIREIAPVSGPEYAFRHALIQEAVYQSMLRSHRRTSHLRVAEALKALYPDRLSEFAALLAHHSFEGGDINSAIRYYTVAGDAAFGLYANAEAVSHYSQALKLASGQVLSPEELRHLYRSRGRSLEMLGRLTEAVESHQELEALGQRLNDRSMELEGLAARATLYAIPTAIHDPHRGRELCQQALALAREMGDYEAEARILWNLLLASKFAGTSREAIAYGEQSLAIARKHNLRQQLAYTLNDLAIFGYVDAGRTPDALETLHLARPMWIELGNRPMQADNLSSAAIVHFLMGDFEQASATAQEALSISQQIGSLWGQAYSQWTVGDVLFERGQWGAALDCMRDCVNLAARAGFTGAAVGVGSSMAYVYGAVGAVQRALSQAREVQRLAEVGLPGWLIWPLSIEVQVLLQIGQVDEAAEVMARVDDMLNSGRVGNYLPYIGVSMSLARGQLALARGDLVACEAAAAELTNYLNRGSIRVFLPDSHFLSAQVLLRLGRPRLAAEQLGHAVAIARSIGSRRSLAPALAALSRIEDDLGLAEDAAAHRNEASETYAYILDYLPDPELYAAWQERSGLSFV